MFVLWALVGQPGANPNYKIAELTGPHFVGNSFGT